MKQRCVLVRKGSRFFMVRTISFLFIPLFIAINFFTAPTQVAVDFQPGTTLEQAITAIKPHTDYLCESDFGRYFSKPLLRTKGSRWGGAVMICTRDGVPITDYTALNASAWADAYFTLQHQGDLAYAKHFGQCQQRQAFAAVGVLLGHRLIQPCHCR